MCISSLNLSFHRVIWTRIYDTCILVALLERDSEHKEPKCFIMGSKHACPLLQRNYLYIPRLLGNLNFALEGDNACNIQSCLLHKHPRKDSSNQRVVSALLCKMCRNARDSWITVFQHWVVGHILSPGLMRHSWGLMWVSVTAKVTLLSILFEHYIITVVEPINL